jgi:hypothetical protein
LGLACPHFLLLILEIEFFAGVLVGCEGERRNGVVTVGKEKKRGARRKKLPLKKVAAGLDNRVFTG